MRDYTYTTCCVNSTAKKIDDMTDAAREVTLETLRRHCNGIDEWARGQCYSVGSEKGLHLGDDYHVRYYRSVYDGRSCYYIKHSCIEYIWVKEAA